MQKRMMVVVSLSVLLSGLLVGSIFTKEAVAGGYPEKDISVIIPFKAGGGTDTSMRMLQPAIEKRLGVKLNFIYKPGAGGVLGYMAVIASKPDGYTIGAVNWPHVLTPVVVKKNPGYELKNIQPVASYNKDVPLLGVLKTSPWKTFQELLDDAKKRPRKITLGHPTTLGYSFETAYELEDVTGIQLKNVYFDGGAASAQAFLGGHVDAWGINGSVMRKYKDKVRPLAVLGKDRVAYYPDTPTMAELGYPGVEVYTYRAITVRAGTDPAKVKILSDAIQAAVQDPNFQKTMIKKGVTPFSLNTDELNDFSKKTLERIKDLYVKYAKGK
jgi:tripartite-type tricarboxylate transporter receptor subunit TctC